MADAPWPCAEKFSVWHTSPPDGPPSFFRLANEFGQVNCPLIFEGTTKALSQLFDPDSKAPYPLCNHPFVNFREFVCWLQLPADVTGEEWYFGCVYFDDPNEHQKKLISEFRELATRAGKCLRKNRRFREWLWPCLQFLSQAERHRELLDGAEAAWWIALLFTKPDSQQLHAACLRKDDGDVVQFQIANPGQWSKQPIISYRLCTDPPLWPVPERIVRPFKEIPYPDFVDALAIPDDPQKSLGVTESVIQNLKQTTLHGPNGESTPCLVVILEKLGWRVFNNRRRRKRLEDHIEDAKKKDQPTTALETQRAELKVELARSVDLLNDCAEWVRVRTGISKEKLVEVATSTAFTEGKDRDDIYAKLGTLDERGLTAELWKRLLSEDRDALVSVKLLPSLESSPLASEADGHRDYVADDTSSPPAPRAESTGSLANDNGDDPASESDFVFRPDGDGYFLRGFCEEGHVTSKGAIGLHDIFRLVQSPGVPVPMLELDAGPGTQRRSGDSQSKQPIADSQTREDIAQKRSELLAAIERADSELERQELQEELESLETEAAKLFGLNGEPRDVNNPNNKLRPKIHGRIRDACQKLKTCQPKPFPLMAEHFELAIGAEGACFTYTPGIPNLHWQTEPTSKPKTY